MEGIKKRRSVFCRHKWVAVVRAEKDGMGRLPENRPVPGKREKSARDGERAGGRQKENRTGSRPEKRSGRWDAKYRFCLRQGGDGTVWLCQAAAGIKSDTGNIHRAGMCLYSPAIRHEARRIG